MTAERDLVTSWEMTDSKASETQGTPPIEGGEGCEIDFCR